MSQITRRKPFIRKDKVPLYLMALPGLVYLIVNNYFPMAGLFIAFKNVNYAKGIFRSPWAGLTNFEFLFRTNDAWLIIRNTLCYNAVFIVLGVVLGVSVALMLNELVSKRLMKFCQTVILLPQLISMVMISYLVYAFLSSEYGFFNHSILPLLGAEPVNWYHEKSVWPFILVFVHQWKWIGYTSLLYLASVVGIDASLYEAAEIDGCRKIQQLGYITLPLLKPTIITMVLLQVGRIFYSDFALFYQVPMNSGSLYDVTNTIDTYVYRGLLQLNDIGMSSAASFVQSIMGFVLVLTTNLIVRKIDSESALF